MNQCVSLSQLRCRQIPIDSWCGAGLSEPVCHPDQWLRNCDRCVLCAEGTELMDKTDARVELRKAQRSDTMPTPARPTGGGLDGFPFFQRRRWRRMVFAFEHVSMRQRPPLFRQRNELRQEGRVLLLKRKYCSPCRLTSVAAVQPSRNHVP